MAINAIGASGVTPFQPVTLTPSASQTAATQGTQKSSFASSLDAVSNDLATSDSAAADVATGNGDIATMTAAMTKSSVDMQLTVAVRNKAVEAYQEIMRMQV
jgi:flagellar hook-basal body complex protein FliE